MPRRRRGIGTVIEAVARVAGHGKALEIGVV